MVVVTITLRPRSHCGGSSRNNKTWVGKDRTLRPIWSSKKQNSEYTRRVHQKRSLGNRRWRRKRPRTILGRRRQKFLPSWVHSCTSLLGWSSLAQKSRTRRTLGSILDCRPRPRTQYHPCRLGSVYSKTTGTKRASASPWKYYPIAPSNPIYLQ